MAVDDLWTKRDRTPSARHGRGKRYRVRYTDPNGKDTTKLFDKKGDAERYDVKMRSDVLSGEYVNPAEGRVTFREVADRWRSNAVHAPNTGNLIETMFRLHVYPHLGDRPVRLIRPSDIQGLVRKLDDTLAPASILVTYRYVAAVFHSAVRDRLISHTPCVGITKPAVEKKRVVPLPLAVVSSLREAKLRAYRPGDDLGALAGLRLGECLGLEVEQVDFLRRTIRVEQQLIQLPGQVPFLAPPKTQGSKRTIPVGRTLIDRLAAHLAEFPAVPVLVVDRTGTKPVTRMVRLICTYQGQPWERARYGRVVWAPAVRACGVDATSHDLRHFYASALIAHGASVTQVQHRLGHATAAETLRTYSHLWPDEDDRTRDIMDWVFREDDDDKEGTG